MGSNEKILADIRILASDGENKQCFDCGLPGVPYINITIGSFVCTTCSGLLRRFNHRVKAIDISTFTEKELEFLKRRTNETCRMIYFGLCSDNPPSANSPDERSSFLTKKYEQKLWYKDPTSNLEQEAYDKNQALILSAAEASANSSGRKNKFTGNASAGLIVSNHTYNVNVKKNSIQKIELPFANFPAPEKIHGPKPVISSFPAFENNSISEMSQVIAESQSKFNPFDIVDPFTTKCPSNFDIFQPAFNISKIPPGTNSNRQFGQVDVYAQIAELDSKNRSNLSPEKLMEINSSQTSQNPFSQIQPTVSAAQIQRLPGNNETYLFAHSLNSVLENDPFAVVRQNQQSKPTNPFAIVSESVTPSEVLPAEVGEQINRLWSHKKTSFHRPNGTVSAMSVPFSSKSLSNSEFGSGLHKMTSHSAIPDHKRSTDDLFSFEDPFKDCLSTPCSSKQQDSQQDSFTFATPF